MKSGNQFLNSVASFVIFPVQNHTGNRSSLFDFRPSSPFDVGIQRRNFSNEWVDRRRIRSTNRDPVIIFGGPAEYLTIKCHFVGTTYFCNKLIMTSDKFLILTGNFCFFFFLFFFGCDRRVSSLPSHSPLNVSPSF